MSRDEAAYLAEELLEKGNLVTYQMVMDHLRISAPEARNVLTSMYQKHQDKFHPKYVVYGSRQGKRLFKFVDHGKLDAEKATFDGGANVQLYSLHLVGEFGANEVAYVEYQALKLSKRDMELLPIKGPPQCQEVAQVTKKVSPKLEPTAARSRSVTLTTKPDPKKPEETKPKSTLTYTSRKRQAEKPASEISPSTRPKLVYKSRKEEAKAPKERVIVSTDDSKAEAAREVDSAKLQQQLADLQAIFDDDDDFLNEVEEMERNDEETPSPKISEDVAIDVHHPDKSTLESASEAPTPSEEPTPEQQTPQPEAEDDGVEHTIDEDGYLVRTQKPKRPAARITKPTRAPTKTAAPTKGKGKKKQMDVASFFGK